MARRILWLLIIAAVLVLPSLFLNVTLHAADKQRGMRDAESAGVTDEPVSYRSPGNRHKVQVTDAQVASQLAGNGGRLVGDYGSFKVFDVSTKQAESLIEKNQGSYRDEYNLIMLNVGAIDTTTRQASELKATSATKSGNQMHLVQFRGPIKPEWYGALQKTGVKIVSYIPSNAYLVYGTAASIDRIKGMSGASGLVQWNGEYTDAYRIQPGDPAFTQGKGGERVLTGEKDTTTLYGIQLFKDPVENARTIDELNGLKTGEIKQDYEILHYRNFVVPLSPEHLKNIADNPDVVSVARYTTPVKFDERQNFIISNNLTPAPGDWLAFLAANGFTQAQFTASGFAVNLSDSGIDDATTAPNHFAFYVSGNTTLASRVIYNRLEGSPNGGSTLQGCDGHGTLNAHIVSGFIPGGAPFNAFPHADASGFRYGMGVAPFVRVGSSVIFDPDTFTDPIFPDLESRAYNDGARISSNSWGGGFAAGSYSPDTQAYDALVRDAQPAGSAVPVAGNQEYVIIFASGNNGPGADSTGTQAAGKNVIAVGASENVHPFGGADFCGIADTGANNGNDIIGFSSRGPTDDQRKKPDLMAPGTHVTGGLFQQVLAGNPVTGNGGAGACFNALGVCGGPGIDFFPAGQQWYTASSGTSHSCPAISGAAALVRQRFINAGLTPASPAMTKAILMNSASHMTGVGANDTLPSNNQGMGLLNLAQFFDIQLAAGTGTTESLIRDQVVADIFTATGQQRAVTGNVVDNTKPFRVTLAWTEPPGPTTGNSFINNLDLEVTVGGQTFRGNVFSGASSVTGGAADIRNNVESVFVPAGVTGPWVARVIATNIAGDGVPNFGTALDQDFALVIFNGEGVDQPVIATAGATITAESCTPPNGAIDPGETVTVDFCLQNVGTLATANLVATLQATGGVTSPSGPQNYGALPPAGPPVCRPFTFTADGSLACGGTLTATLQLQDGATNLGTVTFTFTLGGVTIVGPTAFTNATAIVLPVDTPAPGDGLGPATPYPSDIVVAGQTGTVSKVTIVLTNIEHTFPDDFDILLEGPGGQKVMVMSDVGGAGDILNVTLTLDDAAATALPDAAVLVSGTFRPTDSGATDTMNAPAPAPPYATTLAAFNGTNPNGTWRLWVRDEFAVDDGTIAGGWTLNLTTAEPVCATICGGAGCVLTCPANFTGSNDPNQCGAVVNYPPPTTTGTCGAVVCSPASGSFFPVGTTTVTCTAAGPTCTFTVTVNDTQPPVITCPANVTAVTAITCPATTASGVVNFTTTASDNCPGVTLVCTPASGSIFPVGTTTVTCTATDGSGNTATCSFSVTTFDVCLQDDSNPATKLLINSVTGDYRFICNGTTFIGKGKMTGLGCDKQLVHNPSDRRLRANWSTAVKRGNASIQAPPSTVRCLISDTNLTNNDCATALPEEPPKEQSGKK